MRTLSPTSRALLADPHLKKGVVKQKCLQLRDLKMEKSLIAFIVPLVQKWGMI